MTAYLVKRFLRKPMTVDDLLVVAGSLVANPPLPDEIRTILIKHELADGRSWLDHWRTEMNQFIATIAKEKTWKLQRHALIKYRVSAADWMALYQAVQNEKRISLWKDFVKDIDEFVGNNEALWPTILIKTDIYAKLNTKILSIVGAACYGIAKKTDQYLDALMKLRQEQIEKTLVLKRFLLDADWHNEHDRDLAFWFYNTNLLPIYLETTAYIRSFGDSIICGAVNDRMVGDRWAGLSHSWNEKVIDLYKYCENALASG
jgi:hypothetical protein